MVCQIEDPTRSLCIFVQFKKNAKTAATGIFKIERKKNSKYKVYWEKIKI